ncbi:hypothetical protein TCON_2087 [Astathelohania contejeani]|uniref:Major facilitator superfamily associated domain-containing protein n=1 Tax=Astathelohania contejeani TaxID=164912 RepID=A0ABQ7HX15_9MICR|nr:hypothetical protein TCON_2087 [Thelohania contejeani]
MNLSELNRKYLLSPKIIYFIISLQFYTLHQLRGPFVKKEFGIPEDSYGRWIGFILFLTFFTNIGIATIFDKFTHPRATIIALMGLSAMFFQLFYLDEYIKASLGVFWFNMFLYLVCIAAIPPLLDKITLEILSRMANTSSKTYGKQRLWSTLGYLTANIITESIVTIGVDKDGKKIYDFKDLWIYQVITTILASLTVFFLISPGNPEDRPAHGELWSSWKQLLLNKPYMFFILVILLNGITRASMTMYLALYQTEVLFLNGFDLPEGWPKWLKNIVNVFNGNPLSTTTLFGVFLEIVIFYNSEQILNIFGLYWPLLFAQLAQFTRFAAYYLMDATGSQAFVWSCMFELMKGVNFGMTQISGVQLAKNMCPAHLKATSQVLYSGTFVAIGTVFAGIIFGQIFDKDTLKSKTVPISEKKHIFMIFFIVNIIITTMSILLFLYKYGIRDGVIRLGRRSELEENEAKIEKESLLINIDKESD